MSQLTFNPYIKRPKTQILINKLAKYYRDRNEKISIIKESKIQLSLLFFYIRERLKYATELSEKTQYAIS